MEATPLMSDLAVAILTGGGTLSTSIIAFATVWIKRHNNGSVPTSNSPATELYLNTLVDGQKEMISLYRRTNDLIVRGNAQHELILARIGQS